jgi:hypothetical protein
MLVLVGPKGGVTVTAMSHTGCAPHALPKDRRLTAASGLLLGAMRAQSSTAKHCVVQEHGIYVLRFQHESGCSMMFMCCWAQQWLKR